MPAAEGETLLTQEEVTGDIQNASDGDFELCYDDQGNGYLYSERTGESVWLESGFEFDVERQERRNTLTGEWKSIY